MSNDNEFLITRKKWYSTKEFRNETLYCSWNDAPIPYLINIKFEILTNLYKYRDFSKHVYKHLRPNEKSLEEGVAEENFSYWKDPSEESLLVYIDRAFGKCNNEIREFISNVCANSLTLKIRTKSCTGYLRKIGESEFKEVKCFCIIIDKTIDGIVVKTAYPCEDCRV